MLNVITTACHGSLSGCQAKANFNCSRLSPFSPGIFYHMETLEKLMNGLFPRYSYGIGVFMWEMVYSRDSTSLVVGYRVYKW